MSEHLRAPIRAITLDAGGTLLEPWPSVGQVYADAAADAGFGDFNAVELNDRFGALWRRRVAFDYSRESWARLVAATMTGLTPNPAAPELFDAIWQRFAEARSWRVFPDVRPGLDALISLGIRLAVVSNWDERLAPLLQDLELSGYFEFVLPSIDSPGPKPDPRIFTAAADLLGLPPEAVLHVGDSAQEDVAGAIAAGLKAILLDRAANQSRAGRICSLTELRDRLADR
ncbi:MAG TPA: HAD-IA family hydrolase [Verrucomicrobiota bacterium]|nr:HAD-IA family hydrolase [Verrucomicrobiota bacterium]